MTRATPIAEALLVHAAFVRRIAGALVGPQAADDLCQDAFVAALQQGPVAVPADAAASRSWLATVVRNLFRNQRRGELRRTARERAVAAGAAVPAVDEIVAREELRRRVVDAVLALPADLRDVVLLRYYEDLDSAQIGRRLGRAPGTVRWQLQRAVHSLRQQLDGERGGRGWVLPLVWWERARLGSLTALRIAWPLRALGAAVLLLGVGWLVLPALTGSLPPAPRGANAQLADAKSRQSEERAEIAQREPVAAVAVTASPRGPSELWGRVVTADGGRPVADAVVELRHCEADEFELPDEVGAVVRTLATVRTQPDGGFQFAVTRAQRCRLVVQAAGLATGTEFDAVGGSERIVRLGAAAFLAVQVVDASAKTPIAAAKVEVFDTATRHALAAAATDPGGQAAFAIAPATVRVVVTAPGHASRMTMPRGTSPPPHDVQLARGQRASLAFELPAAHVVHGCVTDAANEGPIAGAEVAQSMDFAAAVRTDGSGAYELPEFDDQPGPLVFARAAGFGAALAMPRADEPRPRVDFALQRGGRVRGRFVDGSGHGLGAVVAWAVHEVDFGPGVVPLRAAAAVRDDGAFVVDGLLPGREHRLCAFAEGLGLLSLALPAIAEDAGERALGDVVLPAAGALEGVVVDQDDRPLADALVHLSMEGGVHAFGCKSVRTGVDGGFRFRAVAPGRQRLLVRRGGWDASFLPIALGPGERRDDVRVRVDLGLRIGGTVVASAGVSPAGLCLAATTGNGQRQVVTVRDDGSFQFERLSAGTWCLCLTECWQGLAVPITEVTAGNDRVVLELQTALVIAGHVVDRDGRPVRGHVYAHLPCNLDGVDTGADGAFTLAVPPGFFGTVSAEGRGTTKGYARTDAVAAGTRDLVLRLQ